MTSETSYPQEIFTARDCTECGDCLPRCPYQLPIPELIKKNLEWYDSLKK